MQRMLWQQPNNRENRTERIIRNETVKSEKLKIWMIGDEMRKKKQFDIATNIASSLSLLNDWWSRFRFD